MPNRVNNHKLDGIFYLCSVLRPLTDPGNGERGDLSSTTKIFIALSCKLTDKHSEQLTSLTAQNWQNAKSPFHIQL